MVAVCDSKYDISGYLNIEQQSATARLLSQTVGGVCTAQECRQAERGLGSIIDWKCGALELLTAAEVSSLDQDEALYRAMQHALPALAVIKETYELERKFKMLTEQWRSETSTLSSAQMIAMHPAYQRIIGMGLAAVPLILKELSYESDHWFWALSSITDENPVTAEDAGNLARMTESWLRLGRKRGWI